ncbi:hypothetical protein ACFVHB_39935 [Kitasatospora sp. NPDC127111]|uniref:hypothetical protein n=1 Tax=Kitasatospora sp. NPDC127111 TaxID=3345363 RepID=UPI003626B22F
MPPEPPSRPVERLHDFVGFVRSRLHEELATPGLHHSTRRALQRRLTRVGEIADQAEAEAQTRRRQAADLEHIATYYWLERRLGIRVALGGRVRHDGRKGVIVDTAGQRLRVMFYGDEAPSICHVT